MLPSYRMKMCVAALCVGVCTMRHGYGAPRGMPNGRQFACGSSCDLRVFMSASAHGSITTSSPGLSPLVMSPELLPPPDHNPEKSGVPSGRCGVGPAGVAGPRPPLPFAAPLVAPGAGAGVGACADSRLTETRVATTARQPTI